MGILAMGIAAVGSLVLVAKGQNRRTLSMAQAEAVGVPPTGGGAPVGGTRSYHVDVDVDGPGSCNGQPCFEGSETGAPLLGRTLVPGQPAPHILNVRVTVSWTEQARPRQAVALQTRVGP